MTRKLTTEIISALLMLLYVYAATSKLLDYHMFRIQLLKSPMLSNYASFLRVAIPVAELLIVLLLMIRRTNTAGLYGSLTLLVLFTVYLGGMLLFSPYVPCSCGGILQHMGWRTHIVFNFCFILLNAIAIVIKKRHAGADRQLNAFTYS